ncbi:MAG TPA: hypothetical protein VFF73_35695 [Planctomycetota bacterium]|nr:hypothetical protein [Planctomycetota bacterium]
MRGLASFYYETIALDSETNAAMKACPASHSETIAPDSVFSATFFLLRGRETTLSSSGEALPSLVTGLGAATIAS